MVELSLIRITDLLVMGLPDNAVSPELKLYLLLGSTSNQAGFQLPLRAVPFPFPPPS